jgi:hypothetical protein
MRGAQIKKCELLWRIRVMHDTAQRHHRLSAVGMEAVEDPITMCITASSALAAAVGAGDLLDVLVPASTLPPASFAGRVVADFDRYIKPDMPGGMRICPRLLAARAADVVLVGVTPTPRKASELADTWRGLIRMFPKVEQACGTDGALASLVLVVPFVDPVKGSKLVEAAHRMVKTSAIENGTLPGEFGRDLRGFGTRFGHVETRRSTSAEYIVVRRLLEGADLKYMDTPEALEAYQGRVEARDAG